MLHCSTRIRSSTRAKRALAQQGGTNHLVEVVPVVPQTLIFHGLLSVDRKRAAEPPRSMWARSDPAVDGRMHARPNPAGATAGASGQRVPVGTAHSALGEEGP